MLEGVVERAHVFLVAGNDGRAERDVAGLGLKEPRERAEHARVDAVRIYALNKYT